MSETFTIRMTARQADWLQRTIDGAIDAGACEGGLEPDERKALNEVHDKLMQHLVRLGLRGKARR